MNTITIRKTALSEVGAALGANYKALPFQYDIALNDDVSLGHGYAVAWRNGNQSYDPADNALFMDQILRVTMVKEVYAKQDDAKMIATLDDLYMAVPKLMQKFIMAKLGIPGIVVRVELGSMSAPEPIGRGNLSLVLEFKIRYKVA